MKYLKNLVFRLVFLINIISLFFFFLRLFKTLNFSDSDIENLQDLWRIKIEIYKNNSINSIASDDSLATYQDSLYLKKVLSKPLIKALREILAKKPADPVEYLGHWLLHFKVS